MKKLLIIPLLLATGYFLFSVPASAQNTNLSPLRPKIQASQNQKEELKENTSEAKEAKKEVKKDAVREIKEIKTVAKDANREKFEAVRANLEKRLEESRKKAASIAGQKREKRNQKKIQNIQNWTKRLLDRDQEALSRLNNILQRIQTRVTKMKAAGKDTTKIDSLIATAQAKEQTIKDNLTTTEAAANSIAAAENPKESLQIAKDAQNNLKESFKDLHRALTDIIKEIKMTGGQ